MRWIYFFVLDLCSEDPVTQQTIGLGLIPTKLVIRIGEHFAKTLRNNRVGP